MLGDLFAFEECIHIEYAADIVFPKGKYPPLDTPVTKAALAICFIAEASHRF